MSIFTKSRPSGKRSISVWSETPEGALEQLDRLLQTNCIIVDNYVRAILCYHGEPDGNPDNVQNYALKFYTKYRMEELWISGIVTGTKCSAANATNQCLMLMGFAADVEKDIYTLPVGEKRTFEKKRR